MATGEGFDEMMSAVTAATKNLEEAGFTEERKEILRKRFAEVEADLEKHRKKVDDHPQEHEAVQTRMKPVKLLDKEARKRMKHEEDGHLPFDPTCRGCIQGAGRERQHRRNKIPQHGVLYVDAAGIFAEGIDVDKEREEKVLLCIRLSWIGTFQS